MPDTNLSKNPDAAGLADTRTARAEDRTMLAKERTFAGWMRIGLYIVAMALGLKNVFIDAADPRIIGIFSEIFVLAGIGIFWAAVLNNKKGSKGISGQGFKTQRNRNISLLVCVLTTAAIGTGVNFWLL